MTGRRKRRDPKRRYRGLLYIVLLGFTVVTARLVWLQTVAAPAYAEMAADQRVRDISLSPRRGSIYDREGEPLAVSTEARTVYATPYAVKDPKGTAAALADVLGGDPAAYEKKLRREGGFVYIARKVDVDRAEALASLDLAGLGFIEDSRRVYPCGELACQVLGFVGVDDEGLAGVERRYDELLAGTAGRLLAERDPFGRLIPGGVIASEDPVDGRNIVLSIDKDVQYEAQVALTEAVKKWKAKSGSVIVMDPLNGEVLALASTPGFDPNDFRNADPKAFRNRPVSDTYEPGSTIKTFTAAAVVDKGLYRPDSAFRLPPTIKVGGRVIHESHSRGTATMTLADIVTQSSNVGAVKLGQALGPKGLYEYFSAFGLTEPTGIDFPGEATGWMPPLDAWSPSSIGNIPFGQGISVTPLQLARALSAVANGGELVTPHLLLAIPDEPDAELVWAKERAISATAAATTTRMLTEVVKDGTGKAARVSGYKVAGKTGTAQKPRKDGKGYKGGGYVGSFSGFLPAEDPRVLIVVTLDEPRNAIYGGVVAAPTFSRLAAFTVSHLGIPPGTDPARTKGAAPSGGAP